jgi:hypothetical protein
MFIILQFRAMSVFKPLVAMAIVLIFCNCQSLKVVHTPYHILPPTGNGATFLPLPARKELVGQLAQVTYAVRISEHLERLGYRRYRSPPPRSRAFDLVVFFDFGEVKEKSEKRSPLKIYKSSSLQENPSIVGPYSFFDILIVDQSRETHPSGILYETRAIAEGRHDRATSKLIDCVFKDFPGESGRTYVSGKR